MPALWGITVQPLFSVLAACVAECICTMLFVLCGCASTLLWDKGKPPSVEYISLSFGFLCTVLVNIASPVSGGHLNPAVTIGMAVRRKISIVRAIFYISSQIIGALIGAVILYHITPAGIQGMLGIPQLHSSINTTTGFGLELLMTFMLVYVVLLCTDEDQQLTDCEAALMIGLTVTACHMFGLQITGCGINPARAVGPAAVMSKWDHHWLYWAGPIVGAVMAAMAHYISKNFLTPYTNISLHVMGEGLCGAEHEREDSHAEPQNSIGLEEIETIL